MRIQGMRGARRLNWLAIPLWLLVVWFMAEVAASTHGSDVISHGSTPPPSCAGPGIENLSDWGGPYDGSEGGELSASEQPRRFDCGVGEDWRRHVP